MSKIFMAIAETETRKNAVPMAGEVLYDKQEKKMYYGDGETTGGVDFTPEIKVDSETANQALTTANEASKKADTAITNAGTATTTANQALTTANQAVTKANEAIEKAESSGSETANQALAKANEAVEKASGVDEKHEKFVSELHVPCTSFKVKAYDGLMYTHFTFRTMVSKDNLSSVDTVIDWGDGTATAFCELSGIGNNDTAALAPYNLDSWCWNDFGDGEWLCQPKHTYAQPGIYTVKVLGKDVWALGAAGYFNICEIFSKELSISPYVTNLSNFCGNSEVLTEVNVYDPSEFYRISNLSSLFSNCPNLESVTGFGKRDWYAGNKHVHLIFNNCPKLKTTDFRLPHGSWGSAGYRGVFAGCSALVADINDLLPSTFYRRKVILTEAFKNCISLTGEIPENKLWNDTSKTWEAVDAFAGTIFEGNTPDEWRSVPAE